MTITTKLPLGHGSHAHQALVEKAGVAKKCAVDMLHTGSRDFEVLQEFIEQYVSFQTAADEVSGQGK